MKLSNVLMLLTMSILLAFFVACSEENAHKGVWEWSAENMTDGEDKFNTGSVRVEVECCKQEEMHGWVASGIIENTTEKDLVRIQVEFRFNGKNGFTLDNSKTWRIDLLSGQKKRFNFFQSDYEDIESLGSTATLSYEIGK